MRKIKRMLFRHFNCIPWLIVGVQILVDGNVSRWQYAMCWICTLVMIWMCAPNKTRAAKENENVLDERKDSKNATD